MNSPCSLIKASLLIAGGLVLSPSLSHANLVFDGLSWAPVDQTVNWSYNDILGEFGAGGQFEGYRHATLDELWSLVQGFGLSPAALPEDNADAVTLLQEDLGITLTSSLGQLNAWTLGYAADGTRFDIRLVLPDPGDPSTFQGFAYETDYPYYDLADPEIGHYLVQPVPEPARMAAILGIAALACLYFRRRIRT